ncbi:DUF6515 family protein [Ideonella sp. A 288]|uniref:DUF6515 family protein n=1 Tax=Ideonella sp. A 288 TaxID=1962181 RepID=UPI001184B749|nr:DUF6515 family protein [Ideonella sp. A 288]
MTAQHATSPFVRRHATGTAVLLMTLAAFAAQAAPDGAPPPARDGFRGGDRDGPRRGDREAVPRAGERYAPRPGGPGAGRWFDGAHGHARSYPAPGVAVRHLPPRSRIVFWSGVNYGFYDGIWYAPGPYGYAVARPPYGVVVGDLPLFRTLVVVGGLSYLYANGVYYRERTEGGYEVVPAPVADESAPAAAAAMRTFVYPRANQGPEQQASDEYECHRWAVTQSGFDPTVAATGAPGATPGADPAAPPRTPMALRSDYQRAKSACLEGRGYTVK